MTLTSALDAAGLTDATIHVVRRVDEHVGPYPQEERNFDGEGRPLGSTMGR